MKNLDMSKLILYTCFQSYFCLLKSCFGKCLQKMSPEKLFEKFVKSAEIFKSDKSGQQKNLYRLVNFKFILNAAAILQIRTIVSIRSLIFHNFVRFGVVTILVRSSTNVVFRVSFCVHSSYFIGILWNDYFRV